MNRPILVFLAPLGCLLLLLFSSLTPFRMMWMLGEAMQPEPRVFNVTSMAPVGGLGAVLFGLGMMFFTLLMREPTRAARILLGFAGLLMIAGAASNAFGDWLMMSAFRSLATSATVDPEGYVRSIRPAKIPMLVGYTLLLVATTGVALAASMMKATARLSRTAVVIGAISFAFLLLMVFWGQTSILPFSEAMTRKSVEPSLLAGIVNGALRSDFLLQGSVVGFAVSTMVVAVSRRMEPTRD